MERDEGLFQLCEQAPDELALIDTNGNSWTRLELLATSNQLARALRARGLVRGDALAIVAPNCAEFLVAYLATQQIGMYLVPINWHLSSTELIYMVENADARAVLWHERMRGRALACMRAMTDPPRVLIGIGEIEGFEPWSRVIEGQSTARLEERIAGRITFYSSATGGKPAAIRQPLEGAPFAPIRTVRMQDAAEGRPNVHLGQTPLYHAAGLLHVLTALHMGHCIVLSDMWSPEAMLDLIQRYSVTTTAMVPAMFVRALKLPTETRRKYRVSSLVQVIHGAAPCPVQIKRDMIAWWGPILWEYYCGSEGQGTFVETKEWLRYPGTVGKPFPGIDVKVLDNGGEPVAPGQVGEIFLRNVSGWRFEYKGDPARTAATHRGDYFTMGDIGYLNDEGYLFLVSRKQDVVNCGGFKVFPFEIEQVLLAHAAVSDCAVIAMKDEVFGEAPLAFVQLVPGREPSAALTLELLRAVREALAVGKVPRRIEYVTELPRGPNGKLYKRLLPKPSQAA